ncbi:pyridoxal phosphate-dependent decarboxylase family protein [Streptomyces otsuchiensis]|uniref:pyridoxal phosphate-dependent decarboxylase family protein n=1 Tax=Streptomyces otsuchiensis TaxID=2681388 RepID=UPI00102FC66F|nr:aminotransferase class V-fold PLP-dependent enzyme [Streptomyces otsuchiensis]
MPAAPDPHLLAGGTAGPRALRPLLDVVLAALADGAASRCGPLPAGGPEAVERHLAEQTHPVIPAEGTGSETALRQLVHALAEGAADPADPHCAAHLHCPPLAIAAAADLAASALNPSMDSWDQAPAATALETRTTAALAALVHPTATRPDALVTTGGTESNQLGVLLARERFPATLRTVCGANAHHSVSRATWLLGLPDPVVIPTPRGVLDPAAVRQALGREPEAPTLLIATAGTTDRGAIDPLPELADLAASHGARLHVDAAYGGTLLFSPTHRPKLAGLERADSVALDLHKLGWQPAAAGLLTVPDAAALTPLGHQAPYLNADDDTEAGLPDLLGRSLRTTRRPDVLKIAVTLQALGHRGLATLVDRCCAVAAELADLVTADERFELHSRPTISTVLFRPVDGTDEQVAELRRRLLRDGSAVLGRALATDTEGHTATWLKVTVLNPHTQSGDLRALLKLVREAARNSTGGTTE